MPEARGLRAVDRRESLRDAAGAELRSARARADLDQEVLADAAGVDASYISRQESRRCKDTWTGVDLAAWLLDEECRPLGEDLLRWLAELAGYDVVQRRQMSAAGDALSLLGADLGAATALHQELLRASGSESEAGAAISVAERCELLRLLDEGDRVRAQLRGALETTGTPAEAGRGAAWKANT